MNTNRAKKRAFKPGDARLESREVLSTVVPASPVAYFNPLQRRVPTDIRTQPIVNATPAVTPTNPVSPFNPLQRRVPTDIRTQPIVNATPANPVSPFNPLQRRVPTDIRTQPIFNAWHYRR